MDVAPAILSEIMKDKGWFMGQSIESLLLDSVEVAFGLDPLGACGAW
jgi:hypothetical protein